MIRRLKYNNFIDLKFRIKYRLLSEFTLELGFWGKSWTISHTWKQMMNFGVRFEWWCFWSLNERVDDTNQKVNDPDWVQKIDSVTLFAAVQSFSISISPFNWQPLSCIPAQTHNTPTLHSPKCSIGYKSLLLNICQ